MKRILLALAAVFCLSGAQAQDTLTFTVSATFTVTPTWTPTATGTFTHTPTISATFTDTPTWSPTGTFSWTPTWSPTISDTRTVSATPTESVTETPTFTWTPTATFTSTPTGTYTATPTHTFTVTKTHTRTQTFTITQSPTPGPWWARFHNPSFRTRGTPLPLRSTPGTFVTPDPVGYVQFNSMRDVNYYRTYLNVVKPPFVSRVVDGTTCRFYWGCDQSGTGRINYGTTTAISSSSSAPATALYHAVTISGLSAETAYYFKAYTLAASGGATLCETSLFTFETK